MDKDLFKLFSKIFILLIPLWLLIILYAVDDPFKVLYEYHNFYGDNKYPIPLNRDFVSTEIFKENYPRYKYDSYIFGSSKALAFLCSEWSTYIDGSTFHFDANGESMQGILKKIEYIDSKGVKLNNCLLVLDSSIISNVMYSGDIQYIQHPDVSGDSRIAFQYTFLTTFLSNRYFIPYFALKCNFKIPKFFGYDPITESRKFLYDSINNDSRFVSLEEEIKNDSSLYYKKYSNIFYTRDKSNQKYTSALISSAAEKQMEKISEIFKKQKTNYRIVLYPLYNQFKLNPDDLVKLYEIFGKENVFDYSGINRITNDIHYYYESEHCRPSTGSLILSEIYK